MSKNLVYHFDVGKLLEVQMDRGDWLQTTSRTFRSYAGNRRVAGETYVGPILYQDTNYLYEGSLNNQIIALEEWQDVSSLKKVRKNSKFAYSNEWEEN